MLITSNPKKKTARSPRIRNGAKGISLLIVRLLPVKFNFCNKSKKMLTTAPIQKPRITADIPETNPRNHPIPRASLASPSPIHRPRDKSHIKAKGRARIGPANKSQLAQPTCDVGWATNTSQAKEIKANKKDKRSGIILCLRS